jgi:hypothetical protein
MPFDRSILDQIDAELSSLEIDDIKRKLKPLMIGYGIESPVFDAGTFLYRARKIDTSFDKSRTIKRADIIYPPPHKTCLGRLNRAGHPVFYSSMQKEAVFFEIRDLKVGDELVLTFWKTNERMFVNNTGYTEFAFRQLGAKRTIPQWGPAKLPGTTETVRLTEIPAEVRDVALSKDECHEIKEAFSRYFMRAVNDADSFMYKLTTAIGELHLGSIVNHNTRFAGVLYPSIRMWANGDNLALLPWFVDSHLEFRKAVHVKIKSKTDTSFDIDYVDAAHGFDDSGNLKWLGRIQAWTLQPKQGARFVSVQGLDHDGDYTMADGGIPVHWEAADAITGEVIRPA